MVTTPQKQQPLGLIQASPQIKASKLQDQMPHAAQHNGQVVNQTPAPVPVAAHPKEKYSPHGEKVTVAQQRAEDIAYTINHALACTATDFIDPWIGKATQKYFKERVSIGCGDEHDHGHEDGVWKNIVGELVGDFGAVPITVAAQRYTPWLMDGIRYVAEPILGDVFRSGAKKAAQEKMTKATLEGMPLSKDAYQEYAREMYRYEIQHLPQGLVWTGTAIGLNVEIQKQVLHSSSTRAEILAGKLNGAFVSSSLLFGMRALATEKMNKWDQWVTRNVFLPTTKHVGKWFNVKEDDVQRLVKRQEAVHDTPWAERAKMDAELQTTDIGAQR